MEETTFEVNTEDSAKKFCTSCGAEIFEEAVICPSCGANQETATTTEEKAPKGFITKLKTDKRLWAIVGGIVAVIVIIVIIAVSSYRTSFKYYVNELLERYPFADNARSADGSSFSMDTNPFDRDPDDMDYVDRRKINDTLDGIKWMNQQLGFSSSVYDDMIETTYLMGRQSSSNDKYKVSWTYHPNKGLEVEYEKK